VDPGGKIMQVGITTQITGIMLDVDRFAITDIPTSFADYTVSNSPDRCTSLSSKIDSRMQHIRN
jgi:hypothetical protein